MGHLALGIGGEHDKGILDSPVGGVGDMRDTGQAVELDVVFVGVTQQFFLNPLAQGSGLVKVLGKPGHRSAGQTQQLDHMGSTLLVFSRLG